MLSCFGVVGAVFVGGGGGGGVVAFLSTIVFVFAFFAPVSLPGSPATIFLGRPRFLTAWGPGVTAVDIVVCQLRGCSEYVWKMWSKARRGMSVEYFWS
ncbi:hypothetical protein GQ44DRAFT_709440 [Phaeosphaeriaceae sp. PMI808]|nr:hypothetical protein GQ44DRAFT_709440 [Phaeosphaeriaceae sp. PMI808]